MFVFSGFPIVCTFDSTGLSAGLRQGQLKTQTDTPYVVASVPVDLTVRFLDVSDSNVFEAFIYAAAGAGIVLSPAKATILTVVVVVGLAVAFAAGLLVGRFLLSSS